MDFTDIVGHERQIESLKSAIGRGAVSHSYLFEGEEGLGKRDLALVFAKTLLCEKEQAQPCNQCHSCRKFDSDNHPDLKVLTPEKNIISLKKIEAIIRDMATRPFEGRRKIYIIDQSHTMRLESQNALLKTLEEPPDYVNIILISPYKNKILPTILSRCQVVKFYPLKNSTITNLLVDKYNIDRDRASFIGAFTKGTVRRSIDYATSDDLFEKREELIKIIDALLKGDKTRALTSLDFFSANKENAEEILDIMIYWFRDLLVYKETGNPSLLVNVDKVEVLSSQKLVDLSRINDIIYRIDETKNNIKRNVNFNLLIETMLLSI
ncbi:MAG: DNA polymerase III subunit delta' [Tissierellaceae bacterium]